MPVHHRSYSTLLLCNQIILHAFKEKRVILGSYSSFAIDFLSLITDISPLWFKSISIELCLSHHISFAKTFSYYPYPVYIDIFELLSDLLVTHSHLNCIIIFCFMCNMHIFLSSDASELRVMFTAVTAEVGQKHKDLVTSKVLRLLMKNKIDGLVLSPKAY